MDHAYFEDRISAYRDKGLPADEYEMIRRHLEECESCRKLYDRLEQFDRLVRDNAALGDDAYWEKAALKIEQKLGIIETVVTPIPRKSAWSGLGWKISAVAASAVLITFIALNKDKFLDEKRIMAPTPKPVIIDTTQATPAVPDQSLRKDATVEPAEEPIDEEQIADDKSREESGRMRKAEPEIDRPVTIVEKAKPAAETPVRPQPTATSSSETVTADLTEEKATEPLPVIDAVKKESAPSVPQTLAPARSPQPEVAAGAVAAVADTIGQAQVTELERWRAVRDSLEPIVSETKAKRLFNTAAPNALQQDRRAKGSVAASDDAVRRELMYLEACYQIARLGRDSGEIRSATDQLRKIADNPESANRDTARALLDQLPVGK